MQQDSTHPPPRRRRRRRRAGLAAAALLLLALALPSAADPTTPAPQTPTPEATYYEHAAVIDAGSTGSRLHLFRYKPGALSGGWAAVPLPDASLKATPGLSAFASEPRLAAASLRPLLRFLQQHVPRDQWAHTPVQLFATAGMRALPADAREAVLASVRRLLRKSGFQFDEDGWARVVSGREEALWAWVAVNYASGALPGLLKARNGGGGGGGGGAAGGASSSSPSSSSPPLLGVLELGGGSMQVALVPPGQQEQQQGASSSSPPSSPSSPFPRAAAAPLELSGLPGLSLYAESFDGLGLQAVLRRAGAQALANARSAVGSAAARGAQAAAARGAQAAAALGRKAGSGASGAMAPFPESAPPHPCLPRGYVSPEGLRGAGGFDACAEALRRLVPLNGTWKGGGGGGDGGNGLPKNDGRRRPRCPYRRKQGGCVFGTSALRPPLPVSVSLVGLDNFFFAAKALGLAAKAPPPGGSGSSNSSNNPTLAEFESAARALCAKPWAEQQRAAGGGGKGAASSSSAPKPLAGAASEQAEALEFLPRACAASTYVTLLLREGLGLPADSRQVSFSNAVALGGSPAAKPAAASSSPSTSFETTWTLGALLIEALELGGPVGVAGRDTAWGAVSAEGAASTSPIALAGAAALYCLTLMALMAAASWLQVGVAWPPPSNVVAGASPRAGGMIPRLSIGGGGAAAAVASGSALPSPAGGRSGQRDYSSVSGAAARLVVDASSGRSPLRSPSPLPVSTAASDRRRRSSFGEQQLPPLPPPLSLRGAANGGVQETELISLASSSAAADGSWGSSPPPGLGIGGVRGGGGGAGGGGLLRGGVVGARRPPGLSPRATTTGGGGGGGAAQQPPPPTMYPSLSPRRGATTGGSGSSPFL
jgi:hypothetical protein